MTYRLKRHERMRDGLRRVASDQIDKAIAEIDHPDLDREIVVHQVRKRCKKLRALLRLFRPALGKQYSVENRTIRDSANLLSPIRDAASIIRTYDDLLDHFASQMQREAFMLIRDRLASRLSDVSVEETERRLAEFRTVFLTTRERVESWKLSSTGFDAIRGGLLKTHQRACEQMQRALDEPRTETLHQLRKDVKYHGYHCRLLRNIWVPVMRTYVAALSEFGEVS